MTDKRQQHRQRRLSERDYDHQARGPLKRALVIGGNPYVLTITPDRLSLIPKGKRKGYALAWDAFVSGEAALATALNASLMVAPVTPPAAEKRLPKKRLQKKPPQKR